MTRKWASRVVVGSFGIVIGTTLLLIVNQSLGFGHLAESSVNGLIASVLAESAGLVYIVLKYFFPDGKRSS
ncbi:MAG: hypothetical protein OEV94_04680 [Deltaproteobacteria bacterium]|nr:hypothetical protein [Deltaproteobacteria bacterium]